MGNRQLQSVPTQQRLALRVVEQQLLHTHIAADDDRPGLVFVLRDLQLQVSAEQAAGQAQRHCRGHIAGGGGQVQGVELDLPLATPQWRKRCALNSAVERPAVEAPGKARLDGELGIVGQCRQQRQGQRQAFELVHLGGELVVEVQAGVTQLQAAQHDPWQPVAGFSHQRQQPFDDVVDVVLTIGQAGDADLQAINVQAVNHPRAMPDRTARHRHRQASQT